MKLLKSMVFRIIELAVIFIAFMGVAMLLADQIMPV